MIFAGDIALPYNGVNSFTIPEGLQTTIWIGNLEGSLTRERYDDLNPRGVYNSVDALESLQEQIPFKAFSIANNHLLDTAASETTISNLQCLGFEVVGGGPNLQEAQRSLFLTDDDGTAYQILAFGWENIQCIPATSNSQGVNPFTKNNVFRCVESALKRPEPVVCFFHWDYELEAYPQPYDRQLAMDLIDMGVVAVIGCHAHRTQPIEFYKGRPIVYGLGNFLFYQGHYMGGNLRFPKFCEEEYAFEMCNDGYKLHYFHYDLQANKLDFVKSAVIGEDTEFDGKAVFSGMSAKEYEAWFKAHRTQKKLLPVFNAYESNISYQIKSGWIKQRGALINLLTKLHLKSANRSNR